MQLLRSDYTFCFSNFFSLLLFKYNVRIVKYCAHICTQHEKCIKMSTNKAIFRPVVLEIAQSIFITIRHLSIETCLLMVHIKRAACQGLVACSVQYQIKEHVYPKIELNLMLRNYHGNRNEV